MKKMNKKGFTIVELVIVIAVIAILAAVLIPTFSGVVDKAQESAAKQELVAAYKEAFALAIADGYITANEAVTVSDFAFTFGVDGDSCTISTYPTSFGYTAAFADGAWTLTKTQAGGEG